MNVCKEWLERIGQFRVRPGERASCCFLQLVREDSLLRCLTNGCNLLTFSFTFVTDPMSSIWLRLSIKPQALKLLSLLCPQVWGERAVCQGSSLPRTTLGRKTAKRSRQLTWEHVSRSLLPPPTWDSSCGAPTLEIWVRHGSRFFSTSKQGSNRCGSHLLGFLLI